MTYDSPFWDIEGEVIPEVANFKEEGLVTQEDWKREKDFLFKLVGSCRELNPGKPGEILKC